MFENEIVNGIHISRIIASWHNVGGENGWKFKLWLESLVINDRHFTPDEVKRITNFADNGKLELECNARVFIKETDWDTIAQERRAEIKKRIAERKKN